MTTPTKVGLDTEPGWMMPYGKGDEKEFDENQPRDEQGRWTSEGGVEQGRFSGSGWGEELKSGRYNRQVESAVWKTMNPAERDAVTRWVQSGAYRGIQDAARGIEPLSETRFYKDRVEALSSAIEKSPGLPEDTVVYRGLRGSGEELDKLQPGATYTDKGFTAVTPIEAQAILFTNYYNTGGGYRPTGVVVKIRLPKGTKAYPTNGHSNKGTTELVSRVHELILQRGFTGTVIERDGSTVPTTITVRPR